MKIGTKSVLFGAHCFILHPFFVAAAWWKLYGFPWDPRLWVAFFVHDLGYWGKPNMDGEEGEQHPYWGAKLMHRLFDGRKIVKVGAVQGVDANGQTKSFGIFKSIDDTKWYEFTLYHSRFLAKRNGAQYSKLCVADKLAIALTPAWLYLPMVRATGEIKEYMKDAAKNSNGALAVQEDRRKWKAGVDDYVRKWVEEHKDIKEDTWTPANRQAINENGVWK